MTDRELLELAAKAAGFETIKYQDEKINPVLNIRYGFLEAIWNGDNYWNPMTDDGDALRLAVKLEMFLEIHQSVTTADIGIGKNEWVTCAEKHGNDPYAATRRAIVRAAAEIGKGMK